MSKAWPKNKALPLTPEWRFGGDTSFQEVTYYSKCPNNSEYCFEDFRLVATVDVAIILVISNNFQWGAVYNVDFNQHESRGIFDFDCSDRDGFFVYCGGKR